MVPCQERLSWKSQQDPCMYSMEIVSHSSLAGFKQKKCVCACYQDRKSEHFRNICYIILELYNQLQATRSFYPCWKMFSHIDRMLFFLKAVLLRQLFSQCIVSPQCNALYAKCDSMFVVIEELCTFSKLKLLKYLKYQAS